LKTLTTDILRVCRRGPSRDWRVWLPLPCTTGGPPVAIRHIQSGDVRVDRSKRRCRVVSAAGATFDHWTRHKRREKRAQTDITTHAPGRFSSPRPNSSALKLAVSNQRCVGKILSAFSVA